MDRTKFSKGKLTDHDWQGKANATQFFQVYLTCETVVNPKFTRSLLEWQSFGIESTAYRYPYTFQSLTREVLCFHSSGFLQSKVLETPHSQ
jgi:hypothetical protein